MQAEGCLNEAKIIGREIADDSWKPNLVLEFEKMKTGKSHKTIALKFVLDSLGV